MCPPEYYEVDYVINPWMEGNIHKSSREAAQSQWQGLRQLLAQSGQVECIDPQPGWPDMVFTANAGVVAGKKAVLSHFLHRERRLRMGDRVKVRLCPGVHLVIGA